MKRILVILLAVSLAASCSFLDVNPKGEVFDNDMFTSAEGYEDALYGIYAELGTQQYLYSDYMYWIPEALGINVSVSDNGLQYMAKGQWDAFNAASIRTGVWSAAYKAINHINNIVAHIEKGGDNEFQYTCLYKGEALGLRALLHFEMLRLFGAPYWASEEEKKEAIPYVKKYGFSITPLSSVDEAYGSIIEDLKTAEACLEPDGELLTDKRTNESGGGFTSCRIIHMNLYAVQALLARVYWSKGDLDSAAAYARKVIDSGKFSFRDKSAFVQYDNGTLDLKETIFGLYSRESNSKNARQYGLTGTGGNFVLASDWQALYNDGSATSETDYRYSAWFDGARLRYLVNNSFIEGTNSYSGSSILGVNVLRLSEMYFIVAEQLLATNAAEATRWYNQAVRTRGLDELSGTVKLDADILYNERRKEFYGEGLHWHDMKRLGKDIKVDASTTLSGSDPGTYRIPLPTSEIERRENK